MGPYCKFCDRRCFVHFPDETPPEALAAYRPGITIIATCPRGQPYEREVTGGWCYGRIVEAIKQNQAAEDAIAADPNRYDGVPEPNWDSHG